jgi:ADP-ribose pyrophosphatase YjhB (NUDIX family)
MESPRAAAVVIEGGRVLLMKRYLRQESPARCWMCPPRAVRCPGHHYSVLPGGHVEEGETRAEAALRELTEETGLRATVVRQLADGWHNGRAATYFLMGDVAGVPVLSGPEAAENAADNSHELVWATAAEFETLRLFPVGVGPMLTALLAAGATGEDKSLGD